MCQFDCNLCEKTLETSSMSEIKERGRTHLHDHHYSELGEVFRKKYRRKKCPGECGSEFPVESQNGSVFKCPTCGHDHFPRFAGQYLWWRLEIG